MQKEKWIEVVEKIEMDESMKERLFHKCSKEKHSQNRVLRYSKVALVASIGICVLVSVPIIARVTSTVLERMQLMDRKEVEDLNEMVQAQVSEADSFSRELTKDERNRKKVLLEAYTHRGRFPEGEIKLVEGEDAKLRGELYYDTQNSKFYLPERALLDEEILQTLEFNEKRDYSLQVINKVEKPVVNREIVNDMGMMEKAQYSIDTVYDVATEHMENTIEYDENTNQYGISFAEGERVFSIRMEGTDLKIKSISTRPKNELSSYKIVTQEIAENEKVLYKKSIDLLENVFHINQEIKSAWCNYFVGDGGRGQDRKLHYLFELEDGSAYIFRYVQEEGTLYEFIYMKRFSDYQTMMERNDPKDLKRGITRESFQIDLDE